MINILAGLFNLDFSIEQALRTFMGNICAVIYTIIEYLYNVFVYLSRAEILDSSFIKSIYSKVGMILGIFMIFKLIFSLIQSLIDPNKFTDKKNGFTSIIYRSIIAIVLLGFTPTIFKEAFKFQNLIVSGENSDNVIYKLVAGSSSVGRLDNMGRIIASDLYFSFFTDDESPILNYGMEDKFVALDKEELKDSVYDRFYADDFENLRENVRNKGSKDFYDTVHYLTLKSVDHVYVIEFNWFLLLITGCFVGWILAMYCVQVAIRVVQLAYLQLIAPVPIISYISDPEGTFKKWVSQCVSTYLDLFFRLAIIYFVVTMIGDVLNQFNRAGGIIFESTGIPADDKFTLAIVKIFIVIGLLLFAQKVPQLLKDLFPNLGGGAGKFSFGLNPKKEVIQPLKNTFDNPIGRLVTKPVKWAGGKLVAPIKKGAEEFKKNRTNRREGLSEARENNAMYRRGNTLYNKYNDDISGAFKGEYGETFGQLRNAKKNATDKENEFNAASDALKEARKTGDLTIISKAQKSYDDALKAKRDADKLVEVAKQRHDISRKKYSNYAKMEDEYGYAKNRNALSGLSSSQSNNSSQQQSGQAPVQQSSSSNDSQRKPHYASQSEYDDRIEFATEKLQELATNGASQGEIEAQRQVLENLERGKEYSAGVDKSSAENVQSADEQFSDGWMSQGRADDSDNW